MYTKNNIFFLISTSSCFFSSIYCPHGRVALALVLVGLTPGPGMVVCWVFVSIQQICKFPLIDWLSFACCTSSRARKSHRCSKHMNEILLILKFVGNVSFGLQPTSCGILTASTQFWNACLIGMCLALCFWAREKSDPNNHYWHNMVWHIVKYFLTVQVANRNGYTVVILENQ